LATEVFDDGVLKITATSHPPGLTLAGEIEESTYRALVDALEGAASRTGHEDIHLDLSKVEFCDAAGMHAMVRLTHRMAWGCRVVLHAPPAPVTTMLNIVGWADLPQLVVRAR